MEEKLFLYPQCWELHIKMTTDIINRKKMFIYICITHIYRECSVLSNSKGWLEFGASVPNLIREAEAGENRLL